MEITYTKVGDYLIPDLTLPPEKDDRSIGIWGMRHKRYIIEHKKAIFTIMKMNGTLQTYPHIRHDTPSDSKIEKNIK